MAGSRAAATSGNLLFLDVRERTGIVHWSSTGDTLRRTPSRASRSEFRVAVEGKFLKRQKSQSGIGQRESRVGRGETSIF